MAKRRKQKVTGDFANIRALVVDDSKATRRVLGSLIASVGAESDSVADGVEALALLEKNIADYQIIFSDISMPKMDGFELCHHVQQAEWYDGTPMVMVSTQSDSASVIRALKLGADDFLPKPFEKEGLAQIMRRVLHDA